MSARERLHLVKPPDTSSGVEDESAKPWVVALNSETNHHYVEREDPTIKVNPADAASVAFIERFATQEEAEAKLKQLEGWNLSEE